MIPQLNHWYLCKFSKWTIEGKYFYNLSHWQYPYCVLINRNNDIGYPINNNGFRKFDIQEFIKKQLYYFEFEESEIIKEIPEQYSI